MSWQDYYWLLEKYDGDLSLATKAELKAAMDANPNTSAAAWNMALQKWSLRILKPGSQGKIIPGVSDSREEMAD
jgi:hypothetical protein